MKKHLKLLDVAAEEKAQVVEVNTETLTFPAVDLLDPVLKVRFDRVVVFQDKALVQGVILKNLIYKDNANTVRHEEVEIPFTKEVEMPGLTSSVTMGKFNRKIKGSNIVNIEMNNGGSTNQGYQDGLDVEIFVTRLTAAQILLSPTSVEEKIVLDFILKISKVTQSDVELPDPSPVFECRSTRFC